jgi:hypothetical protein
VFRVSALAEQIDSDAKERGYKAMANLSMMASRGYVHKRSFGADIWEAGDSEGYATHLSNCNTIWDDISWGHMRWEEFFREHELTAELEALASGFGWASDEGEFMGWAFAYGYSCGIRGKRAKLPKKLPERLPPDAGKFFAPFFQFGYECGKKDQEFLPPTSRKAR